MDYSRLFSELSEYDTPTICNALELISDEYRLSGYGKPGLVLRNQDPGKVIIGFALTARISAAGPASKEQAALKHRLYKEAAASEYPTVICMEDIDRPHLGSFWGEMQASIFRSLGSAGAIVEGGVRDLPAADTTGFGFFSTEVVVSHAYVHIEELGVPVTIRGQVISKGDIIHADRHGFVIIPASAIERLPFACKGLAKAESHIINNCQKAIREGRKASYEDILSWYKLTDASKKETQEMLR